MEVFEQHYRYDLGDYRAKHIYEKQTGEYISLEDFVELMKKHFQYRNNHFMARLKRNNLKRD